MEERSISEQPKATGTLSGPDPRPRVLVLDGSAAVRGALRSALASAGLPVEGVADLDAALGRIDRNRPDVLILGIELPRTDGLRLLQRSMASSAPIPALVCSTSEGPDGDAALQALEDGAVGVISRAHLNTRQAAAEIVSAVRGAAQARLQPRPSLPAPALELGTGDPRRPTSAATSEKVVVVGASTGGIDALRQLLQGLPADSPGIAVAQPMPEVFTSAFARRLRGLCRIEIKEAESGDRLFPGRALVAPGGQHLAVRRDGDHYFAEVLDGPLAPGHGTCVDTLFRSAAEAAGPNAIGVILTGVGRDGTEGLLEMRQAGGHTIAQEDAASAAHGIARRAIEAGAACEVLPLSHIPAALTRRSQ